MRGRFFQSLITQTSLWMDKQDVPEEMIKLLSMLRDFARKTPQDMPSEAMESATRREGRRKK
jgi:hypothetical protein